MTRTLDSSDKEPAVGTVVFDFEGRPWSRQPEGYWLRDDDDDADPESWIKVAGNYGPVTTRTSARQVASWARKAREATQHRDEAIRAMRDEGSTLRAIAEAAGLTHAAIAKIVAKG